jgi:hypothetical protein
MRDRSGKGAGKGRKVIGWMKEIRKRREMTEKKWGGDRK